MATQDILARATKELEARLDALNEQMAPLEQERQELQQALRRLNGSGDTAKGVRSSGRGMTEDAVRSVMAPDRWESASEVAAKLNSEPAPVVKILKRMMDEGSVRRQGERRGTKYSLA